MNVLRFCVIAALLSTAAISFAQPQNEFRSSSSGPWTNSKTWEVNTGGVWLPALRNEFPGEAHNREVSVSIEGGQNLTIADDEIVRINSLIIGDGQLVIDGTLIIDEQKNDPFENNASLSSSPEDNGILNSPQLSQNTPNPVSSYSGYKTEVKFYLDKSYEVVRLSIYDELGNRIMTPFNEHSAGPGWRSVTLSLDRFSSGTYPVILEVSGRVFRKMLTIVK